MLGMRNVGLGSIMAVGLVACAGQLGDPEDEGIGETQTPPTFEEFLATVEREPFEDGVWIVDHDIPIETEKGLVEYYENLVAETALTVSTYSGRDQIWSSTQKRSLTYCVSTSFGTRHSAVVSAMAAAAASWEAVADVNFTHLSAQDGSCTSSNTNVLFDVRPISGTDYLARAFFPNQSRYSRNVLIDSSSFYVSSPLTLAGILRHELGHVLGFRHEHTRYTSNECYEDSYWRAVTSYDRASVMHYPECGGSNWAGTISTLDAQGAASLYGAPGSSTTVVTPTGTPMSGAADSTLAPDEEERYEALSVLAGTKVRVAMTGTGDADLYVRFGSEPTTESYNCRPYRSDSNETCDLTVPSGASRAYVMVRGYTDTTYHLEVSWTAP